MSPQSSKRLPRIARTLFLAAAIGLVTVPAAAQTDPCVDPETGELVLTEQQVYIHPGDPRLGNLAGADRGTFPSWNETKPSQSATQGAGGAYLAPFGHYLAAPDEDLTGFTVVGAQGGCLDTMLIELYAFLPTNRTGSGGDLGERPFTGMFSLDVNGTRIVQEAELDAKTVANAAGPATYRLRVAITGLHDALELEGIPLDGTHTIRFIANARFANTSNAIFVYDTTEVPAGIRFNGAPDDTYAILSTSPE